MEALLRGIQADPAERDGWLALSDWLEEEGRADEADFVRLRERLTLTAGRDGTLAGDEERLRQLLLRGVRPACAVWTGRLAKGVEIRFSLIPPGEFLMGSLPSEPERYDNEGPRHLVRMTRPYYMGVFPVTQEQYRALTGESPSETRGPKKPVDSVDGHQAEEFCRLASEALDRAVRLPTEAEWEFACRGGTTTEYYTGDGPAAMRRAGWCSRSANGSARATKAVGSYQVNPWGLYDTHGNVREWCADNERRYTRREKVDPVGPASNTSRVVRGGSWYYQAEDSRSASRYNRPMGYRLGYYGFRVMMPVG